MYTRLLTIGAVLVASLAYLLFPSSNQTVRPPYIQGKNRTVLFLANAEYGLSNVHIATAYSLLENYPDIDVHYASFPEARNKIARVSSSARTKDPTAGDITFHPLSGKSFKTVIEDTGGEWIDRAILPPGAAGLAALTKELEILLAPWSVEEHMELYDQIGALIDEVDPAVVVLETFFRPAIDSTRDKHRQHAIITPNTLVDNFQAEQPYGKMFWKYPATSSGFSFPVPLKNIPENIYMNIRLIYTLLQTPALSAKKAALSERGLKEPINFLKIHRDDVPWVTMNTEGASIPVEVVPRNVTCAGPILLSSVPVAEQDAELAAWLKKAPTMLVNLGSLMAYNEERATTMALALADLLSKTDNQILWKMKRQGNYSDEFLSPLKKYIQNDQIRVLKWLSVDPVALLESGDIIASVHHGGSNCYHEAIAAGIVQVILPLWIDLYDFAALVETIGVGVWACKAMSPNWSPECLGDAFRSVVSDSEAGVAMRGKARQIGDRIQSGERGRDISAREISKLAYVRN